MKPHWWPVLIVLLFILFAALMLFGEEAPHVRQPELEILCWKVHYTKGTFTCKQGTWDEAPNDGVQVVTVWYKQTYRTFTEGKWQTFHYRHICSGEDYYWLDGCGSADEAAAYTERLFYKEGKVVFPKSYSVKTGRWTSDRNFQRIYNRAMKALRPPTR